MQYIVLDLEWNSAYYKKQNRFINEIIQIGAVRLDERFDLIDTFQMMIKSGVTKKLSRRFIDLTGITNEQMLDGVPLEEAVRSYNAWVGEDTLTMSWSNSDLYAIMENTSTFLEGNDTLRIDRYLDLQTYVQNELRLLGHDIHNQISVSNAAEMLNIPTDGYELHTAKDDAFVCALLLKKTYQKDRFEALIQDTTAPDFYKRLTFKPYYIANIHDERVDQSYLSFTCPNCKRHIKRTKKWFYRNNWLRCELYCGKCETKFKGMLSIRQTYDNLIIKRRLLPIASVNEKSDATL